MSDLIRNSGAYQRLTSSTQELERLFKEVDEKKSPPDIKKVLLLMGLGSLSWISTYSGLLELIQANSGSIAFTYKLAIGFAVAMLMLMIVYILDQLFAPLNWLLRTIYIFGYIFLTIISVGFGFGFYWKFLESRSEATRSAESAVTQVQSALQAGQTRLEQLEQTLTSLTALSLLKAKEEREKGNSCPNSRPGDGPRRRLRDQDAKNFSFAGDFVTKRAQSVANDINKLNGDLTKIASRHPSTVDPTTGTRNAFMKKLNQQLDLTITRFNAFRSDPQLRSIRNNLAERSTTTVFPTENGGTFKCPDSQLQSALRGVVAAIDQLPRVQKPVINAVEGSEATIEAFRRLGATLKGLVVFKLPPSEDELRKLRKKAVRSVDAKKPKLLLNNAQPGLNERDYIPLAIAIFVDFCLLLVSINRPMDRLKSLVPVMKDARDGPISGILSSFHATHFAGMREEFSLFQHVVFDWGGHYYVAVPLASNDVQAQYLANLFVSLEGRGIVDRAMIPPGFIIRGKLKKMGSSFADHRAFRLYKFRNGAWSNIVMDAVMGAAKDVSIAMADQAKRHPMQTQTLDDQNQERNPNFESLFHKETSLEENNQLQKTAVNGKANSKHPNLDEAPIIEMPRLFRSAKSEKEPRGENIQNAKHDINHNVIKPASFTRGKNNHNQLEGHNNAANSLKHQEQPFHKTPWQKPQSADQLDDEQKTNLFNEADLELNRPEERSQTSKANQLTKENILKEQNSISNEFETNNGIDTDRTQATNEAPEKQKTSEQANKNKMITDHNVKSKEVSKENSGTHDESNTIPKQEESNTRLKTINDHAPNHKDSSDVASTIHGVKTLIEENVQTLEEKPQSQENLTLKQASKEKNNIPKGSEQFVKADIAVGKITEWYANQEQLKEPQNDFLKNNEEKE